MKDLPLIVLFLLALILGVAWVFVPFILLGISRKLDELLDLIEGAIKQTASPGEPPDSAALPTEVRVGPRGEAPDSAPLPTVTRIGPVPPWEKPKA